MSLPDGLDWIMRPVVAEPPLCTLKELQDGTYTLTDVARMNDALDVRDENLRRGDDARRAAERNR